MAATWSSGAAWGAYYLTWSGTATSSTPGAVAVAGAGTTSATATGGIPYTQSDPAPASARVEVAFASYPDDPVQLWTDISPYVRFSDPITMSRGRADEFSNVNPGRLSLTLDNTDGRFTYDNNASPYWPNVKPRKRVRVSVSPDGETWLPRFDGYVDGWPAQWAGGVIEQPRIVVTASDRLSRLSTLRPLDDPLQEELGTGAYASSFILDAAELGTDTAVLAGGVVWLYGLQESNGSTTAGDVSGASGRPTLTATQVGADGTLTFGASGIVPEGTAAEFTPASAGNGVRLYSAEVGAYLGTEFSLWCQFVMPAAGTQSLFYIGAGGYPRVLVGVTSTTVYATFTGTEGATATATKTIAVGDNAPHFALVSVSGTTISLYVDQESAATATVPAGMGYAQGMYVGGTASAAAHQVAWVGYSNAATSAARASELGGLATGAAERSDLRVARVLRWLGLDGDTVLQTGLSDVAYQACGGRTGLDIINEANAVESGVFFPTGDGRFAQQSRDHRYNATTRAVFTAEDVDIDLQVAVDTIRMVNDLSVSRPAGATYRARNEDSIRNYGAQSQQVTLYAASDTDLILAADWQVQRYGDVAPRIPSIGVDLLTNEAIRAAALDAEIGDRITVTGLPSTTTPGGATVDLFVEGVSETISATSWQVDLATSPGFAANVWVLDDATYSVLDSTTVLAY